MLKIKSKLFLSIVTLFLALCLLTQVLPFSDLGMAAAQEVALQEPVTKNERGYELVTTFVGNSSALLGDKITANGAGYDIKLDGETVGGLVFNKNDAYIEIIITDNVIVDVTWSCSAKYANCTLTGMGTYNIPQLLQDNGKTQTFNALWITDVRQNDNAGFELYIDATSFLQEMGYSKENKAPPEVLAQLLRSYDVQAELLSDGTYHASITSDLPVSTYNVCTLDDIQTQIGRSATASGSGSACLIIAIWDYPGTANDLGSVGEDKYNYIDQWLGYYDYRKDLVNSDATYYNIWAWLTWLCSEYDNVDVYFSGHGAKLWFTVPWWPLFEQLSAFVCYDAINGFSGSLIEACLLNPYEFKTGALSSYDYSALRVGVGSFCYGWGFSTVFLNPGGSITHQRAFTGPPDSSYTTYSRAFVAWWGYRWYNQGDSTYEAYLHAYNQAATYGGSMYNYADTGSGIWF